MVKREEERGLIKPFSPRMAPTPIPESGPFDPPYSCLKVNDEWRSHVVGVLEALDQPDAWNGTDGEIETARGHARAIIEYLVGDHCPQPSPPPPPPTPTPGGPHHGPGGDYSGCSDCSDDESEDCMGNCGPEPPIRIQNGVLQYFWCCEWVDVGSIQAAITEDTTQTTIDPDLQKHYLEEVPGADPACRVASYITDHFTALWNDVVNEWAGGHDPRVIGNSFRAIEPEVNYDTSQAANLTWSLYVDTVLHYFGMGDVGAWVITDAQKARLKCAWLSIINDDDPYLIDGGTKTQLRDSLELVFGRQSYKTGFIKSFCNVITTAGFNYWAQVARTNEDADCSACDSPDEEPTPPPTFNIPQAATWAHDYDFSTGDHGFSLVPGNDPNAVYQSGLGYKTFPFVQFSSFPAISKTWAAIPDFGERHYNYIRMELSWPDFPSDYPGDPHFVGVFWEGENHNHGTNAPGAESYFRDVIETVPNFLLTQPTGNPQLGFGGMQINKGGGYNSSKPAVIKRITIAGYDTDPAPGDPVPAGWTPPA